MATPTIQRRRLGNALKRARDHANKTQDEAAVVIDAAASKISRLELGQSGIKLTDLALLLDLYGVSGEQADWMRDLARAGRQRGRWSGYRTVIPDWFRAYVDLEADASEIRWYQPEVVPGILQTESYIRAMNATAHPRITDEAVNRQVKVRLERQAVLDQPVTTLSFILSESALRRNIGDASIMQAQLIHLAEAAERPNVELQVLPFDAQTYGAAWIGFTILRFDHDATSDVVYVETYTDGDYLDSHDEVQAYTALWNRLQAAAMGQVESRNLIIRLADEKKARP
ncbi:MAG: DNA-binding protein [Pseudonocardiales bacterium]|nr:Scr1 family TA system antitoxin-like transcriptional regulator [Actinomycetota bacterium]PZS23955.1 MAG: DNA-binding protein [Pseudonocardiales bacterium]